MAPEQLWGAPVDFRIDLYAAGVVLFEMLTGVKPFRGKSITEIMSSEETQKPQDLRALNPAVPNSLERVINKSLAFDPSQRYANAAALSFGFNSGLSFKIEMLEQIRRTLGEYNFAGQYQQAPSPQGGGMVKAAWFRRYAEGERPEEFDRVVQSWDTANKASELSDFSVCTSWGIKGKDLYLLHVLRKRMEYPELKRAVCEQCEAFTASVVLIEDKASGTQLIQELIDYGLHAVTRYQPQSDKIMRMHAQTAMIENGFVHLPKEAGWLPEYLHELTAFPKGKHDDQVDSTAQMLDWIKRAGGGPTSNAGIWHLYRERYEAQQAGAAQPATLPPTVDLIAHPPAVVTTPAGAHDPHGRGISTLDGRSTMSAFQPFAGNGNIKFTAEMCQKLTSRFLAKGALDQLLTKRGKQIVENESKPKVLSKRGRW